MQNSNFRIYHCSLIADLDEVKVNDQPEAFICGNLPTVAKGNSHHRVKRFTLLENNTRNWNDPRTPFPLTIGFENYWTGPISREIQDDVAIECATVGFQQRQLNIDIF